MPAALWLVDRSRIADGRGFCQRARYLNYHSGPTGYGIALKGTSLPLMTGTAAHEGLRPILEWCRDHILEPSGEQPPDEIVRGAIQHAQALYGKTIEARGFAYMADQPAVQELVQEQNYLIAGLIWAWVIEVLPEVLSRGKVLEVEHDDTYVIACTCGLGNGILAKSDHEARECAGIGFMCKPDFLVETWQTHELEYHEFKTTGADNQTFRDKWEVMIQMFAATLDAERRHHKQVGAVYVHGLLKGRREGEYNYETGKKDGTYRQQSPFCYGYRKPDNPPMEREDWQASYDYQDADGKNRRLGKAYKKTGIWELPDPAHLGMDRSEWWVKAIPSEVRRKQLILLGPFVRQEIMVPHFLREVIGEEARWRDGLWEIYEGILQTQEQQGGTYWQAWSSPGVQGLLDGLFPRSYECRRYGQRSSCQFETVCFEKEGFADPLGSGRYIERRPHHVDEMNQAVARGLMLPDEGAAEEIGE